MNKYYYTIGEVGNLLGVKPYVIRYWETEFNQLRPKKGQGRIRKFNEDQILLLRKIKDMLYVQRFTIEGARKKLKDDRTMQQQTELDLTYAGNRAPGKDAPMINRGDGSQSTRSDRSHKESNPTPAPPVGDLSTACPVSSAVTVTKPVTVDDLIDLRRILVSMIDKAKFIQGSNQ
ncbi:MAG: MerR family transcriptional regulator [Candidatus Cloacimonetes bacterium]|nr:MerR family transcriptional regulator [Candidatus Cloacimonadota bacterium]